MGAKRKVLVIDLDLSNAAMQEPTDVADVLRGIADYIDSSRLIVGEESQVFDYNGNRVGKWRVYKRAIHPQDAAHDLANALWSHEYGGENGSNKNIRQAARTLLRAIGHTLKD